MAETDLEQAYERLLARARGRGELLDEASGKEQRRHPRMRIRVNHLPQRMSPWPLAVDISLSGMAFYTDEPCEAGRMVNISLGTEVTVAAEVLACHEVPLLQEPSRFRVRCRFADDAQGLRMLVAVKEMEATQADAG
jgi:hypothetical protein